jgi:hypothetical protein
LAPTSKTTHEGRDEYKGDESGTSEEQLMASKQEPQQRYSRWRNQREHQPHFFASLFNEACLQALALDSRRFRS